MAALGSRQSLSRRAKVIISLSLFLLSFSIKSLHAVDLSPVMYSAARPGAVMTSEYDREAAAINEGRNVLVPGDWDPADTSLLVHAPGYPLYLSAIYSLFGRSYFTVQLVQNLINSISPVLIFFIAGLLITRPVGIVSGLLDAVSHHVV